MNRFLMQDIQNYDLDLIFWYEIIISKERQGRMLEISKFFNFEKRLYRIQQYTPTSG